MQFRTLVGLASACLLFALHSSGTFAQENPVEVMETSMGTISIELFDEREPGTGRPMRGRVVRPLMSPGTG